MYWITFLGPILPKYTWEYIETGAFRFVAFALHVRFSAVLDFSTWPDSSHASQPQNVVVILLSTIISNKSQYLGELRKKVDLKCIHLCELHRFQLISFSFNATLTKISRFLANYCWWQNKDHVLRTTTDISSLYGTNWTELPWKTARSHSRGSTLYFELTKQFAQKSRTKPSIYQIARQNTARAQKSWKASAVKSSPPPPNPQSPHQARPNSRYTSARAPAAAAGARGGGGKGAGGARARRWRPGGGSRREQGVIRAARARARVISGSPGPHNRVPRPFSLSLPGSIAPRAHILRFKRADVFFSFPVLLSSRAVCRFFFSPARAALL